MTPRNRYAEAFKENYNIIGLAGAVALAAASLNPLLLLPAFVLEAAYLIFVPDSGWYSQRLARRHDAEIEARREQMKAEILPTLRPDLQRRFLRLEELRRQIGTLSMGEKSWFLEVLRKLDYLLDKFLQFATKEGQFRAYLASIVAEARGEAQAPVTKDNARPSWLDDAFEKGRASTLQKQSVRRGPSSQNGTTQNVSRGAARQANGAQSYEQSEKWVQDTIGEAQKHYDDETDKLRALLKDEKDPGTIAVLEKRCEVLERRREFVGKMGRILQNLNHQLELLEDTFGLISDEIRARPPEQVLADIEDVVTQTNTMTQVLEEIAPYEQSLARLMN